MATLKFRVPELADVGSWAKFRGGEFLIRRHGCPTFNDALDQHDAIYGTSRKTRNERERAAVYGAAYGLIADWKSIKDEDGNDVPYSGEMAFIALNNDDFLFSFVWAYANNLSNFYEDKVDGAKKKSRNTSRSKPTSETKRPSSSSTSTGKEKTKELSSSLPN